MEEKDELVRVKLVKQPLASERKENRRKWIKTVVISISAAFLLVGAFIGGYFVAGETQSYYYSDDNSKFNKISELIQTKWLYANDYEDLEDTLTDKALYGMADFEDDPYTGYMSAEDLESFTTSINMDYVGIGVQYSTITELPEITRVFKESPAEAAGILAGDIIIGVDDVKIDESNMDNLKEYVLGEEGTVVMITVLREGKQISFDVVRGAVDSTVWGEEKDGYAYLQINSFGDQTAADVEKYLKDFESDRLIIDLRDDSGGYQTAVQAIAGLFIGPDKVYMKQAALDGVVYDDYTKKSSTQYEFEKIAVLVNGNTASAAEVLTICLKEQLDNVTIVGTTTYGKGVVQSTMMIEGDSALKLTTSKWLSPVNAVWINGVGITPDEEVKLPEVAYMTVKMMEENEEYGYDDVAEQIKAAEMLLDYLGYKVDRTDGYFSMAAVKALVDYKADHDLGNSEVLDYNTYTSLIQSAKYENSFNTEKDTQLVKAVEIVKG